MTRPDKVQIGLTPAGDERLSALVGEKLFRTEGEGFKFAIALALALELDLESAPNSHFGTKFQAAGGVDRDGLLSEVIRLFMPDVDRPYAVAERLAELGLAYTSEHLRSGGRMGDLLDQCLDPPVEMRRSDREQETTG